MGCDPAAAEREEARRFVAAYEALLEARDDAARAAGLEALKALPLHGKAADEARDLCVAAQGALLEAERAQEQAASLLERALEGAGGEPLPADKTGPIARGIERSEAALLDARGRFSECEDAARGLSLRYGER